MTEIIEKVARAIAGKYGNWKKWLPQAQAAIATYEGELLAENANLKASTFEARYKINPEDDAGTRFRKMLESGMGEEFVEFKDACVTAMKEYQEQIKQLQAERDKYKAAFEAAQPVDEYTQAYENAVKLAKKVNATVKFEYDGFTYEVSSLPVQEGLLDPDMPTQQLLLYGGEMTESEMRTARAFIRLANSRRQPAQVSEDDMIKLVDVMANGWEYGTHPRKKVEIFLNALNTITRRSGDEATQ